MTKTNFKITNKLPLWLAIPAVLILAGLVLFFVLGFNPAASITDNKALTITHDLYVTASDDFVDELQDLCDEQVEKIGLTPFTCNTTSTSTGGKIEYTFDPDTSDDTLNTLQDNILQAIAANENLKNSTYTTTIHTNVSQYAYEYIWRAAISFGVALALAFVYISIRYRLSMGLAALIAGVADTAMMLALTIILRIPVTTALATAAIFAVLYSILVSTVSFNKMRTLFKSEEYASKPAADAVEEANEQAMKGVFALSGTVIVFFVILSVFAGSAIRAFALPAICGVVASTFSGVLLSPALVCAFKEFGEKRKAAREEKKRLAKQQEEEERANKRSKKQEQA